MTVLRSVAKQQGSDRLVFKQASVRACRQSYIVHVTDDGIKIEPNSTSEAITKPSVVGRERTSAS